MGPSTDAIRRCRNLALFVRQLSSPAPGNSRYSDISGYSLLGFVSDDSMIPVFSCFAEDLREAI